MTTKIILKNWIYISSITENDWEGDPGDIFHGNTDNRSFNHFSNPSSQSYSGGVTCINVSSISDPKPRMDAFIGIECKGSVKQDDRYNLLKNEQFLDSYQEGYNEGYKSGYTEAIRELKK